MSRRFVLVLLLALPACTDPQPAPAGGDPSASRAAFLAAYPVFLSPRCVNCHPSGDAPLQGDDGHVHGQNVTRGPDGKGLFALKCALCHFEASPQGPDLPPGHPNWHLPPGDMPMVFQGRSPAELAAQLQDPTKNGGKTLDEVLHHVTDDSLVRACFTPPGGRTPPPLSHDEFAARFTEWVRTGAAIPE